MATTAVPLQRRSNRRAFLVAAVFGLIAAFLTFTYLKGAGSDDTRSIATVPAVFAARDIPERTVIKDGMVEVRQIAVDARHNLALSEKAMAVGQTSRQPIAAGEQLLRNKVADGAQAVGFSADIPQGKRAVAVGVNEVVATGGHIGVGDYIDVIGVFEVFDPGAKNTAASSQGDKPKAFVSVTLLQNIQVLAVAQNDDPTLQTAGKASDNVARDGSKAKSVTLALTPEQAEKIFLAEETGVLRLALRPFGDDEQRKIAPVTNDLPSIVGQ